MTMPLAASTLLAVGLVACSPSDDAASAHRPYLEHAIATGHWLDGHAVRTDSGQWWPAWLASTQPPTPTLGAGVGGVIVFYLALAEATGDDSYRLLAAEGGRWMLDTLPSVLQTAHEMRTPQSLYGGLPSVVVSLEALYDATGDTAFRNAARATVERLHDLAQPVEDGVEWTAYNDLLFGSAGTGLLLLEVAERWNDQASLDLARRVGETLLQRAEPVGQGLTWRFRRDREIYLPNFSHGAAGVGFFLGRLYQATGDSRYRDAALAAGTYLADIARTDGGGVIVPYSVPNGEFSASWDIGWAHGPAGSARLFYLLWRLTDDRRWHELVGRSLTALRHAGVPGTPQPMFETEEFRIDLRFGLAGVAMFALDWYQATGDSASLTFGQEIVDTLVGRATTDSTGTSWTIPQYGFMPHEGEPTSFAGYFYGAAGFGLTLLRLDGALQRTRWEPVLPDNPWDVPETMDPAQGRTRR